MFKTIVMTAVTLYLFACSSLYADSDYYGKIGFGSLHVKGVEGTDSETRKYSFDRGLGFQLAVGEDYEIMSIEGDKGARKLLDKYASEIVFVEVEASRIHFDIDTIDDFDEAKSII